MVYLITCHSKYVLKIATEYGWLPGARYTNLRDIRTFNDIGLIDIDWKLYDFEKHIWAVKNTQPHITIARDIESIDDLDEILVQAEALQNYARYVCICPKDKQLEGQFDALFPSQYRYAYSVPTKYGGTTLKLSNFDRPVHLLGGRPDQQRELANQMNVFSVDVNRFTLDAKFGDYFDGTRFVRYRKGGYEFCLRESIRNITQIWSEYPNEPIRL